MKEGRPMCNTRLIRFLSLLTLTFVLTLAAACGSIGPRTMDKDQLDYGDSIANNWKNQMLSNIVKLRFVDMPVFVDVGSIVAGYSMESQVSGRLGFSDSFTGSDSQGLSAGGKFTDRPTITYMPKTGDDYLRSLLAPVEPKNLLALIQAGYNAEMLFTWSIEAINGVQNYSGTEKTRLDPDPEFYELAGLMSEMQSLGAVAWQFDTNPDTGHDVLLIMRSDGMDEEIIKKRNRIAEISGQTDFVVAKALACHVIHTTTQILDHGMSAVTVNAFVVMACIDVSPVLTPLGAHRGRDRLLADGQYIEPEQHGPQTVLFAHVIGAGTE